MASTDNSTKTLECTICLLDKNEIDRRSVELKCGHSFCLKCLMTLHFLNNVQCPYCRVPWNGTPAARIMELQKGIYKFKMNFHYDRVPLQGKMAFDRLVAKYFQPLSELLCASHSTEAMEKTIQTYMRMTPIPGVLLDFQFWSDLVLGDPDYLHLLSCVTLDALIIRKMWTIRTSSELGAATSMLAVCTPQQIAVDWPQPADAAHEIKSFIEVICKNFRWELRLIFQKSYQTYSPCDDIIEGLRYSSCLVTVFCGCLDGDVGMQALISCVQNKPMVMRCMVAQISMLNPLQHRLKELSDAIADLTVKIRHQACSATAPRRPLNAYVNLIIEDTPSDGLQDVVNLVFALVPEDDRFGSLSLRNCALSISDLDEFRQKITARGLSTRGKGAPSHGIMHGRVHSPSDAVYTPVLQ